MKMALTIILIAGVVLAVALGMQRYSISMRVQGHQRVQARVDLAGVIQALNTMKLASPGSFSSYCMGGLNASNLYAILTQRNNAMPWLEARPDWNSGRAILDPWGHPINVQVTLVTNYDETLMATISLWSCGPNGKNENGFGDDISDTAHISLNTTRQP